MLITSGVHAQVFKGIVVDGETTKPLSPVTVMNLSTEQSTETDAAGNFYLPAKKGDVLTYSFVGYHTIQRIADPAIVMRIELLPLTVSLQEYILHPGYTPFQRDSAEMSILYSKELNTQKVKPSFSTANGGGVSGLIGSVVQKMSKSYKQNQKFKATFKSDIEQKYIDTRYTPALVGTLTNFTGDTLALFMNSYPMEYDFARAATDLELKMWIRSNYKDYLHKNSDYTVPAKK